MPTLISSMVRVRSVGVLPVNIRVLCRYSDSSVQFLALTDFQTPQCCACETLRNAFSGRALFGGRNIPCQSANREREPSRVEHSSFHHLTWPGTIWRATPSASRGTDRSSKPGAHKKRCRRARRTSRSGIRVPDPGGVLFQRNAGSATLLGAVVHQTFFADVQVAAARAATPIIRLSLKQILLELVIVRERQK
jgi:hypothetical protein